MAFLRFLLIVSLAIAVPVVIAEVSPPDTRMHLAPAVFPAAARMKLHAHFEELPVALVVRHVVGMTA